MNRRTVIKNFVFVTAGFALLPGCGPQDEKVTIALKKIKISGSQQKLLQSLIETILPSSPGKPGAKEVASDQFTLTMVDDCATKADQEKFMKGLKGFEDYTSKKFSKPFQELTAAQKDEIMKALEKKEGVPEDVQFFYGGIRGLTLQCYMSSEFYLTNVEHYEMVPGRWHGCFPMKSA